MEEENAKEKAPGNGQDENKDGIPEGNQNTPGENPEIKPEESESTAASEAEGSEMPGHSERPERKRPGRMYRSYKSKIIMGVCGGLGEFFNVDAVVFRLMFILSLLLGGWGVLAYVVIALVVPYNPAELAARWKTDEQGHADQEVKKDNSRMIMGAFLVLLGLFTFLKTTGLMHYFSFFGLTNEILIPFILVALGILLIYRYNYLSREAPEDEEPAAAPERFYRSDDSRLIAGVCGGLGEYLSVDANLVRFIWLLLTFTTLGVGLLLYILFAVIVPKEKEAVTIEE